MDQEGWISFISLFVFFLNLKSINILLSASTYLFPLGDGAMREEESEADTGRRGDPIKGDTSMQHFTDFDGFCVPSPCGTHVHCIRTSWGGVWTTPSIRGAMGYIVGSGTGVNNFFPNDTILTITNDTYFDDHCIYILCLPVQIPFTGANPALATYG